MSIFDSLRVQATGRKFEDRITQARTLLEVSEPTAVGLSGFGEVN